MAWDAYTALERIGVGTGFHVLEAPTHGGMPPGEISTGDSFCIHDLYGRVTEARVCAAATEQADIELPDGTRWRMTPRTDEEHPTGINSDSPNSRDWIVREQLAYTSSAPQFLPSAAA